MKLWYKRNYRRALSAAVITRSVEAKLTLSYLHDLAAHCDADGLLLENGEPMKAEQIVTFTGLSLHKQRLAINELQIHGLIEMRADGTIVVLGWMPDPSPDATKKRRQRFSPRANVPLDVPGQMGDKCDENDANVPPNVPTREYREPPPFVDKSTHSGGLASPKNGAAPWVLDLRQGVREFADSPLRSLGFQQRLVFGRYAAWRWANYSSDEGKNRAQGLRFAQQLAEMGDRKNYAEITVREFVGAGDEVVSEAKILLRSLWYIASFLVEKR